jgi:hypothetical protein
MRCERYSSRFGELCTLYSAPSVSAALVSWIVLHPDLPGSIAWAVTAVVAVAAAAMLPVVRTLRRTGTVRIVAGVLLGTMVVAAAMIRMEHPRGRFHTPLAADSLSSIQGIVRDDLRPGASRFRRLEIELLRVADRRGWQADAGGIVVLLWEDGEYLSAGEQRRVPLRGDRITVSNLAGVPAGTPPVLFVSPDQLLLQPAAGIGSWRGTVRTLVRRRLGRLDSISGPLVLALLLGDRGDLPSELSDLVRRAGAAHVLALSGMHLGVMAAILQLVLRPFAGVRSRMLLGLPALSLFVWIAGWIPSLVRALVLVTVVSVARFRYRRIPTPLVLGADRGGNGRACAVDGGRDRLPPVRTRTDRHCSVRSMVYRPVRPGSSPPGGDVLRGYHRGNDGNRAAFARALRCDIPCGSVAGGRALAAGNGTDVDGVDLSADCNRAPRGQRCRRRYPHTCLCDLSYGVRWRRNSRVGCLFRWFRGPSTSRRCRSRSGHSTVA